MDSAIIELMEIVETNETTLDLGIPERTFAEDGRVIETPNWAYRTLLALS